VGAREKPPRRSPHSSAFGLFSGTRFRLLVRAKRIGKVAYFDLCDQLVENSEERLLFPLCRDCPPTLQRVQDLGDVIVIRGDPFLPRTDHRKLGHAMVLTPLAPT
jgi:hypothetical protein